MALYYSRSILVCKSGPKKVENRHPFATNSGSTGLSSYGTPPQIGNIICCLSRGPYLLILRKEADGCSFIGPCYLHGFMDIADQEEILTGSGLHTFDIR
jgi:hypothetical protein